MMILILGQNEYDRLIFQIIKIDYSYLDQSPIQILYFLEFFRDISIYSFKLVNKSLELQALSDVLRLFEPNKINTELSRFGPIKIRVEFESIVGLRNKFSPSFFIPRKPLILDLNIHSPRSSKQYIIDLSNILEIFRVRTNLKRRRLFFNNHSLPLRPPIYSTQIPIVQTI